MLVDELEKAILQLLEDIDGVATHAIWLAGALDEGFEEGRVFDLVAECRSSLNAAEALLTAVANRGGLSWDRMAARYQVSKQSLHRRLSLTGEDSFANALRRQRDFEFWTFDPEVAQVTARNAATELKRRAAQPRLWRREESDLNEDEVDLAVAWLMAKRTPWAAIVRRPDDSYRPPRT